jgi:hypothetical protein
MKVLTLLERVLIWPSRNQISILTIPTLIIVALALLSTSNHNAKAQQGSRDEVRIELTSSGFTPTEVRHAPGRFAIAVENTTLSGEYMLRLKAEDGTLLNEFQVQKGSSAWTINLQTGTYVLTETDHPQWTCRIVIQ